MKSWDYIKKGDVVEIVAPASRCSDEELQSAVESVESLGLAPRLPKNIFSDRHPIFSGSDKTRFEFLKSALMAKDSKIVWCLRGGYGSIRLLPWLAKMKRPSKTKLLLGLSDISTLHNFINQKWKWPSIHGPMLGTFSQRSEEETREITDVIFGRVNQLVFEDLIPMNKAAEKKGRITAPIVGGNLMTVQSSQGTDWAFHARNSMVFLEEINERGYRLDRLLVSLQQAEYFKKAKAIVLGDFLGGDEPDGQNFVNAVLYQFAQDMKIPVLKGLKSGHGSLRRPIPFATKAVLDLKANTLVADANKFFEIKK